MIRFLFALIVGAESVYPERAGAVIDALADEYATVPCPDEMQSGRNFKTEARQDCHRYAQEWRAA